MQFKKCMNLRESVRGKKRGVISFLDYAVVELKWELKMPFIARKWFLKKGKKVKKWPS